MADVHGVPSADFVRWIRSTLVGYCNAVHYLAHAFRCLFQRHEVKRRMRLGVGYGNGHASVDAVAVLRGVGREVQDPSF